MSTMPTDDLSIENQAIERRRAMAQALMQSPAPQGRMVGRVFVGASPLEFLAQGLRQYGGRKDSEQADADQKALGARVKAEGAADVQKYVDLLRGKPAQTFPHQVPMDEEGNAMPVAQSQATAPDPNAALTLALGSRNPGLQAAGGAQLKEMTAGPKWERVERPMPDGSKVVGYVNVNSREPWATFQAGGTAPVKREFVNGQGVNAYTGETMGAAIPPQLAQDSVVTRGPNGELVPNTPVITAKSQVAAAGKPTVSVDARQYSTQESEQSKAYGKELGDMRGKITQAGYTAPAKLAQLDRMESLLSGIDGGAAAPALAEMSSFAQSLGIKLDPKLGVKQAAESLAREMAGSLRQPGTGPMTDKDFDNFMKQVPSLSKTAEGRAQITQTMRAAIERDVRASQFAAEYAEKNGGTIDDKFFRQLQDFYVKNPVIKPAMPERNANGDALPRFEAEKEKRYQDWKRKQGIK